MKRLLDSVILIDALNGMPQAVAYLEREPEEAVISVITRAEVLTGLTGWRRKLAADFLDRYHCLTLDTATADAAAQLRQTHQLSLPDACQAALAQRFGLRLVTRNTRDFPAQRFPFVEVPY